ncbi:2'-5' RNA ligase family protein [Nocardioides mesophilus]|uniref:2'-5' RNA ligase family protein n=1 Tax=Nocardioides mesophilus TaxID=433659 RepID=A0A7G9RH58_9ACTN|nr:2'-5' RNA ligase family protein [Nocardioides mesophilus]
MLPVDPPLALSEAIPPHFTLLSPWHLDPTSDAASGRLREAARGVEPFRLHFTSVGTFPSGHVYLQPDPAAGLDALFAALTEAFPEFPPYGGAFSDWLPHLTVSRRGGEATASEVRREVEAAGPLALDVGMTALSLSAARAGHSGLRAVGERLEILPQPGFAELLALTKSGGAHPCPHEPGRPEVVDESLVEQALLRESTERLAQQQERQDVPVRR